MANSDSLGFKNEESRIPSKNKKKMMEKIKTLFQSVKGTLLPFAIICFGWVLFEPKLMKTFDNTILPFLESIEFNTMSHGLFMAIALLLLYPIYNSFKNRYYIPPLFFLTLVFGVFVYIRHRYFGVYISTPQLIFNFGYIDILILLLTIFLLACIYAYYPSRRGKKESNAYFVSDRPIDNPDSDILDYSKSAKKLAESLVHLEDKDSYSIGIIAPWGTGKTSYLNLLEYYLKEIEKTQEKELFTIIRFNPRHSSNSESIQEDFFENLFSELKKHDSRFSYSFKDYLKAINVISSYKLVPFLLEIHKIWNKESEKEKVNRAITRLGKRIIVIIDDFDRLLSDEIIEVLKLIDGNASFNNMIFITAYDKKHINKIIGDKYYNEGSFFSDKFFTTEIQVPLVPYPILHKYLKTELLNANFVSAESRMQYDVFLDTNANILEQYFTTLREIKRFINLFIEQFKHVQGEVEFGDYFLLYLIKFAQFDEYSNLHQKKYLEATPNGYYTLDKNNRLDETNSKLKEILKLLFSKEESDSKIRSINQITAFEIYFYNSVGNRLSMRDMDETLKIERKEAIKRIDQYKDKKQLSEFISFLYSRNILTFDGKDVFEQYISLLVYIYCNKYDGTYQSYQLISKLIYKEYEKQISETYAYEGGRYKELISSTLKGNHALSPTQMRINILIGLINGEIDSNHVIFSKEEILNISTEALKDFIENKSAETKQDIRELLYACISSIDPKTRRITLDKSACEQAEKFIKKNPLGYFSDFVRLGSHSSHDEINSITCEPFWEQIFQTPEKIEDVINNLEDDQNTAFAGVKNFWKIYKNNSYKPIHFDSQGNVKKKIENGLKDEIKELEKLLKIEREFKALKIKTEQETIAPLSKYKALLERTENINLNITKRWSLLSEIESKLKK